MVSLFRRSRRSSCVSPSLSLFLSPRSSFSFLFSLFFFNFIFLPLFFLPFAFSRPFLFLPISLSLSLVSLFSPLFFLISDRGPGDFWWRRSGTTKGNQLRFFSFQGTKARLEALPDDSTKRRFLLCRKLPRGVFLNSAAASF